MKSTLCLAVASLVCICCASGCGSNLSPGMKGLAHNKEEVRIARQVEMNQNARMISDELARTFYLDHPSHLSPYPVTDTSGYPR